MSAGLGILDRRIKRKRVGEIATPEIKDRFVLPLADHAHVVDAIRVALDVPVHHRCTGEHPERMRGVHHLQPRFHVALAHADLGADRTSKNLAPAAGE